MILDLPPNVQMIIEHTAKAQGTTAEQLAIMTLTQQFTGELSLEQWIDEFRSCGESNWSLHQDPIEHWLQERQT